MPTTSWFNPPDIPLPPTTRVSLPPTPPSPPPPPPTPTPAPTTPFYKDRQPGTCYKPYDLTADSNDDGVINYIRDRRPRQYQYITQELEDPTDEPFLQRTSRELIIHPTALAQTERAPDIKDLATLAHLT